MDWDNFRAVAALQLYSAALSNSSIRVDADNAETMAKSCVAMADLLIKVLKAEG